MLDIATLTSDVTALSQSVVAAHATLDELAALVASLSPGAVTQEQIDALDAQVKAAQGELDAAVAEDTPPAG